MLLEEGIEGGTITHGVVLMLSVIQDALWRTLSQREEIMAADQAL